MHEIKFEFLYKNGTEESCSYMVDYTKDSTKELNELITSIDNHIGDGTIGGYYKIPYQDSLTYIVKDNVVRVTVIGVKSYAEKLVELKI